ncbi:MAG: energy transducer TonB [Ignavibacteria bacterium]|nr:energy transducer TonB [Ignavibacteria bacterium]
MGAVTVPTVGIPIPVPDEIATPGQSMATQTEMAQQKSNVGIDDFSNVQIKPEKIDVPVDINEEPDMNIFVPVEKQPEMVRAVTPEYPEIAKRAGITGKVYVKVLVDKEGRPKKTVVLKSDSELFNQAAIDAAMKSAFSPALQNQRPIAVWITLPYKFTLEGQN